MRRSSETGFTLAEMLVALFITGLISAAGASLLVGASQSGKQMSTFQERLQKMEVAHALIRNDIAAMIPLTFDPDGEIGVAGGIAWHPNQSEGTLLYFYRNGWLHSEEIRQRSDLQAVEYAIKEGALVRITHLPAVKKSNYPQRVLVENVDRIELRVFQNGRWAVEPQFEAFEEIGWPEMIELTIFFSDDRSFQIVALSGARQ